MGEFADVTFDNVTTPGYTFGGTGGRVHNVTSHYADYLSCNGGKCDCMVCGDRVVSLNHAEMKQVCPMSPAEEEWVDKHYNPNATSVPEKQAQECHSTVSSLPQRKCNCPNLAQSLTHVGDGGCTWSVDPVSFSISMGGLVEKGGLDPKKTQGENIAAAMAAYNALGARPCGSSPDLIIV